MDQVGMLACLLAWETRNNDEMEKSTTYFSVRLLRYRNLFGGHACTGYQVL